MNEKDLELEELSLEEIMKEFGSESVGGDELGDTQDLLDTIAAMERIAWWDWSHEQLRERLPDFNDVPAFIAKYDK